MRAVVNAVLVLSAMGGLFGLALAVASKLFAVKQDARYASLLDALPGANCGGCGFAGCAAYAQAILNGSAELGRCAAGGQETAEKLAALMGREPVLVEKRVAFVRCQGTDCKRKGDYVGLEDCLAAMKVAGNGPSACANGCLGFGNCTKVCRFGAISVRNGVAVVDQARCTGCMACQSACPRHVIVQIPASAVQTLACANTDPGAKVRALCENGCLGCWACEKRCPSGAISVRQNLAEIQYAACTACGQCASACPRGLLKLGAPAAKR